MDKEEKDDEVTIDFSKVKRFFKKDKENKEDRMHEKTEPKETEVKEKQDEKIEVIETEENKEIEEKPEEKGEVGEDTKKDDEITLDFSRIKGFFKKKKEVKEEVSDKKADEETINISGIFESFNKNRKFLIPLIIILICISFSVYFRTQPAYLPVTDDWARSSIYNQYKSQISSQINQQNPFLPEANKNEIVEKEFNNLLKTQKAEIEANIVQLSNYFKSRFQDESGQTYLVAIDPYFWYRNARNYLEHGFFGDIEIDGNYYSTHRMAPFMEEDVKDENKKSFGGWFGKKFGNLNVFIEVWLYRLVHLFNENVSLMAVCFYVPVIISSLAVIPAFFIAKRVSGNVGGFFAALMVAIHPFFISRTAGGFADTDPYNVFFPLLIAWIFLEAFEAKDNRKRIFLAALSGLSIGLFSFAWSGWSFIFLFLIATAGIYMIYQIIVHRKEFKKDILAILRYEPIKNTILILVTFLLFSGIFVISFTSLNTFTRAFTEYIRFAGMKAVAVTSLWYNVYTTVAELNPLSWNQIVQQIGSSFLLFVAFIGVILTLTKKDLHGKIDIKYAVLIMMWFFSTIYASTKGVRFVLIMVPAFSLGFGIALGVIYNLATKWISKEMQVNKMISCFVIFILLSLLMINPMKTAQATAKNEIPSMNDAWYEALTKIRENSSEDAIINSWWDFGHWFKAIADRGVTLDGGGQNQPQAHWLGKLMLTSDEKMSVGILRMLDCGKHYGFMEIENTTNNTIKTMDILYEIIPLDKSEAENALLKYGFSNENISRILKYTHCKPPENYFITSEDMVRKSGVWGHFGSWDFRRASMYQSVKKVKNVSKGIQILMDKFNLSEETADKFYYEIQTQKADNWVTGWPGYVTNLNSCSRINNNSIQCNQNLGGQSIVFSINLTTMDAVIPASPVNLRPASLVYPTEKGIDEREYKENIIPYSIAIIESGDSYQSIMMAPELASSMFTRLFFYDGKGLEHYEKFHDVTDVTGARIIVWKINWEGKQEVGTDE